MTALPSSDRLDAEPASASLAAECHWDADERVAATMGGTMSLDQLERLLDRLGREHERDGFSYWLWRERSTGRLVARGGPRRSSLEGSPVVELGWIVDPERWGEGIATELGRASVDYARELPGLDELWAWTLPQNVRSRAVMEAIGMRYSRDIVHAGMPHVAYELVIA